MLERVRWYKNFFEFGNEILKQKGSAVPHYTYKIYLIEFFFNFHERTLIKIQLDKFPIVYISFRNINAGIIEISFLLTLLSLKTLCEAIDKTNDTVLFLTKLNSYF